MTTTPCTGCAVQQGTHQPADALHQIAEPKTQQPEALRLAEHLENFRSFNDDLAAAAELRRQHARIAELEAIVERREAIIRLLDRDSNENHQHAQTLSFELECMLIDPHEHWDSAARALDAYKQAQGPSPSPFATDVPIPPERKAIYAALRAKREAEQAKQVGA